MTALARFAHDKLKDHAAALLMGLGHGATHWVIATVYVILPFIAKDLGLTYTQAGGLISLFHAASFIANAGSGTIVDITGRHVGVACLSLVLGAFALIGVGFSPSLLWLYLPIIVIGLTNNLWHPAAISYLSRVYPGQRGFALSLHTLGATMGDLLAPLAAGLLLVVLSWQQTAIVNVVPVFAVALVLLVALGKGDRERAAQTRSSRTGGNYLAGLKALAGNRSTILLCAMAGFRSMTQNGLLFFLPLFVVDVLGAGSVVVGLVMTGIQAGAIVSGPLAGAWSDQIGRRPVVLTGLVATTIVLAAMCATSHAYLFIGLACLLGFVMFAIRPVIHGWAMDLATEETSGSAVSLLFGTQSAFTMLVPVAGGFIADAWGLPAVFYILIATIAVATAIAAFLSEPKAARV